MTSRAFDSSPARAAFPPAWWLALALVLGGNAVGAEHFALQWATYLGGNDYEHARDVCTDPQGNVYVVGGTRSTNFPIVGGTPLNPGPRTDPNGSEVKDAFVAKFSPEGQLLWSTCLGGPNYERAYAVELDPAGNIFIAGRAGKEFPVTAGAFQTTFHGSDMRAYGGWQNGFVAKFAPGGALLWASYVGTVEMCRDLAVDAQGDVYVPMGYANRGAARQSATEPAWMTAALASAFQPTRRAGQECGVVKIKGDGSAVLWATWLGGGGNDSQEASIRLDQDHNVFVLPYTLSADAPTTAGAHDRTYNGGADYYLARLSPDGRQLLYGTYLGGPGDEYLNTHNLAVNPAGHAYISVSTSSTNFPTTPGAYDHTYNGGAVDWGVAKFSPSGQLLASTFIGGSGADNPDGIYVDAQGNVFCTGASDSPDFPTTPGAYQTVKGGGRDAVLVWLRADFGGLLYGTFIGGAADEDGRSGFLDAAGNCYIVGQSPGAGWPAVNAYQGSYRGGALDNIVAKFTPPNPALRLQSPRSQDGAFHFEAAPLTPTLPYTIERIAGWDGGSAWAPVHSFTATSSIQAWAESTGARTRAFYRVRSGAP